MTASSTPSSRLTCCRLGPYTSMRSAGNPCPCADRAAQILAPVAGEFLIEKAPARLAGDPAAIAHDADDRELLERLVEGLGPVEVAQMHVIMDEEEYRRVRGSLIDGGVVYGRQSRGIAGEEAQLDACRPKQRQGFAEGRGGRESVPRGPRRADDRVPSRDQPFRGRLRAGLAIEVLALLRGKGGGEACQLLVERRDDILAARDFGAPVSRQARCRPQHQSALAPSSPSSTASRSIRCRAAKDSLPLLRDSTCGEVPLRAARVASSHARP